MHELSVAEGILDIVRCYVPATDGAKVRAVKVRVGRMAGVLPYVAGFLLRGGRGRHAVRAGIPRDRGGARDAALQRLRADVRGRLAHLSVPALRERRRLARGRDRAAGGGSRARRGRRPAVMSVVTIERKVLEKNDAIAARTARGFAAHRLFVFNIVSSPGAGKTTLLERTIERLRGDAAHRRDRRRRPDRLRRAARRALRRPGRADRHQRRLPSRGAARRATRSTASIWTRSTCSSSRTSATSSAPPTTTSARR